MKLTKKAVISAVMAAMLSVFITSCSGPGNSSTSNAKGSGSSTCGVPIVHKDAPVVSVWAWYPNMKAVATNFNNDHSDVQVCWNVVGSGGDEYNKLQTGISAGRGLPDIAMVEAGRVATYQVQGAVLNLNDYGVDKVKSDYPPAAWEGVTIAGGTYAVPVDSGPMGLIYRKDLFQKYDIAIPKTWAEFEAAGLKMKAAGGPMIADLSTADAPYYFGALIRQAGGQIFDYDSKTKTVTINLTSPAANKVMGFWQKMLDEGIVATSDYYTTDFSQELANDKVATWPSAAWAPGYMSSVTGDKQSWAAAPLPQWDLANPVQVNYGGSTFMVLNQAKDKKLAAKVAMELYTDQASLTDGWKKQIIFPFNLKALDSSEFLNAKVDFFGGQQANKEVFVPAAKVMKATTFTPFQAQVETVFTTYIGKLNHKQMTAPQALEAMQKSLTSYATKQGFKVKK